MFSTYCNFFLILHVVWALWHNACVTYLADIAFEVNAGVWKEAFYTNLNLTGWLMSSSLNQFLMVTKLFVCFFKIKVLFNQHFKAVFVRHINYLVVYSFFIWFYWFLKLLDINWNPILLAHYVILWRIRS